MLFWEKENKTHVLEANLLFLNQNFPHTLTPLRKYFIFEFLLLEALEMTLIISNNFSISKDLKSVP
jgi:hypothetical protein